MRTWNAMDNYMDFYDTWTGFLYWIQKLRIPGANG